MFGFHGLGLTESFRAMFEDIFVGVYKGQNACRVLGFGLRGFEGFGLGAKCKTCPEGQTEQMFLDFS